MVHDLPPQQPVIKSGGIFFKTLGQDRVKISSFTDDVDGLIAREWCGIWLSTVDESGRKT